MKTMMSILLSLVATMSLQAIGETVSNETLKDEIRRFLRPVECVEMIRGQPRRPPVLTEKISFDGDTNRLARILVEVAQTNNAWYSEMAMRELVKYGTVEQLPFLYSCATNPAIGELAVRAILNIDGVTTNSIGVTRDYLFQTNRFPYANISDRSNVCCDLIARVYSDTGLTGFRSNVVDMVQIVERDFDVLPSVLDAAVISVKPDFQYSRRRLLVLRAALQRQSLEYQDIVSSNIDVGKRTYVYSFQTNYLQNAINELVAYPEANLPD